MVATISVDKTNLIIEVNGMDELLALKSKLTIPLSHIRNIKQDGNPFDELSGVRSPGTYIPGWIAAGTFRHDGRDVFWDVHRNQAAVIIELEHDRFDKLVIGVDEPAQVIQRVRDAIS